MSDEQNESKPTSPQNDSTPKKIPEPPPLPPDDMQMSSLIKGKDGISREIWWLKGLIDE
jgi:hypothetical protein